MSTDTNPNPESPLGRLNNLVAEIVEATTRTHKHRQEYEALVGEIADLGNESASALAASLDGTFKHLAAAAIGPDGPDAAHKRAGVDYEAAFAAVPGEEVIRQERTIEYHRRVVIADVAHHGSAQLREGWGDHFDEFVDAVLTEMAELLCELCTDLNRGPLAGLAPMQRGLVGAVERRRELIEGLD